MRLIDADAAIDEINKYGSVWMEYTEGMTKDKIAEEALKNAKASMKRIINELPTVQPTLYGYNIEHLELIARVLQKEDLAPERVTEMLTDIGRIVAIVADEFEETLRKAVERCTT